MTALRILAGAGFVYAVCRACGHTLFHLLGLHFHRYERAFLEFLAGSAVFSTLVFVLAACQLLYTPVLIGTGIVIALLPLRFRSHSADPPSPASELSTMWKCLFWLPYLVFGALYLVVAMVPETSPDGTGYHLSLVRRYLEHRGFLRITTYMFAGFAQGIEMLFAVAFSIGRHSAAAVLHLLFLLAMPFGMRAWARRAGDERVGVLGGLLFYLAPVVGRDGTIAYIDIAAAAVVFAAFYFLEIWREDRNDRVLVLVGLLSGFTYACKMTTAATGVCAFLAVLVLGRLRWSAWRSAWKRAGVVALCATLVAGPWMLKDWIEFGNPFFPLFNRWFPSPWMYPIIEVQLRDMMSHTGGVAFRDLAYQAVIGGKLLGVIGPVFCLAPVALLALRRLRGRVLLAAFIPAFLPFFANTGGRFLIPSLPFLALALGVGILEIPVVGAPLAAVVLIAHSVLSWPDMIPQWSTGYQWRLDQVDWRAALRIEPEEHYLATHWNDYRPGLMLDRLVPPGDPVFSPNFGQMAYQHRNLLGSFDSAFGRRTFLMFLMPVVKELATTLQIDYRFTKVTTSKIRMVATSKMDTDLRISELRVLAGQTEAPRTPDWRTTASDNPWESGAALDGIRASWWTSGRFSEPGMWFEVDFGKPVELDGIQIEQSEDQRWLPLAPWAWTGGKWQRIGSRQETTTVPPRPTLRSEVRDEMNRSGVHWMLLPDGAYGADDLRDHAGEWGIRQVGMENGFRLYSLQ